MSPSGPLTFVLLALLPAALLTPHATGQGVMQDLGTLGGPSAIAVDVSADGSVVVGESGVLGFRWTPTTGMQDLGTLGGTSLSVGAVSADGQTVVGNESGAPFRWTTTGGMQALGTFFTPLRDVNADGSVIAGYVVGTFGGFGTSTLLARRWTASTGFVSIGVASAANAVNSDGSVIVGGGGGPGPGVGAYRWTAATGSLWLGTLPGGQSSIAYDVSADGSVVVGFSGAFSPLLSTSVGDAFRWDAATGMQNLGTLSPGAPSAATGVNSDGSVIVGKSGDRAFRWTAASGMQDLGTLTGASDASAYAVSADGSVVVGESGGRAFRWTSTEVGTRYCTPEPNSTGRSGLLNVYGSNAVTNNDVELSTEFIPANAFGFFIASMVQGSVAQPGGSQGVLCLGGSIGRYVGPGQIQNAGNTGAFSLALDLTMVPTPTGLVPVQPGDTWNFQAWYRDANPGPTSNFTDAVTVTFL